MSPQLPELTDAQLLAYRAVQALLLAEKELSSLEFVELHDRVAGRLAVEDTAKLAQALHRAVFYLPFYVRALSSGSGDGKNVQPDEAAFALNAAVSLSKWTERLMRGLDSRCPDVTSTAEV
ncbi:hypothetical protein [Nocardia sp. CA-135398]|uniref:hypothetical protein n=1 Tax=Nocardia sp. CA-135398 TaxID=3239977 RepID=UPI003D96E34D